MPSSQEIVRYLSELIQDTFGVPDIAITRQTVAEDIPGWDSTSHVVLILSIEDHFGITLDPEMKLSDVGELADEVQRRCAAKG
jgi:acyl carrier protein